MRPSVLRGVGTASLCGFLFALLSCGHDQKLVSITIQPAAQEFLDPNPALNVQLRALGQYIHPPVTKDITNQVTWTSNTPNLVTVSSTGVVAPTGVYVCGGALVSATATTNSSAGNLSSSGAIITGTIVVTVDNLLVQGCPGFQGTPTQPTLTVDFSGAGSGTVSSSPPGLGCASACSANFANGTSVTLTATPATSSTFGAWAGCDSISGSFCTVALTSNRTVTVTFN